MGKMMRNHDGDTTKGLAQWIGRKIRHHGPLELAEPRKVLRAGVVAKLGVAVSEPTTIYYSLPGGKRYQISVRALADNEIEPALVAVGA